MPLVRRSPVRLGQVALSLAMLCVVSAPLLVGAVHAQVVVGLSALAHLALALHVVDRALSGRPLALSWLGLPFVVGLALTLFEITPLPEGVRAFLAPVSTERVAFVASRLPEEYRALVRPVLSLDPPATGLAALRLSMALCVFVVVADRCRRREGRRLAYRWLLVGGAALVAVAFGHRILNVRQVYGELWAWNSFLYAPLVNQNHLARAFGAFALFGVGYAFLVRSRLEAALSAALSLFAAACVVLTDSFGGLLAFLPALGVLLLLSLQRDDAEEARRPRGALERIVDVPALRVGLHLVGVALLGGLVFAGWVFFEQAFPEGEATYETQGKLILYRPSLELFRLHLGVGTGNSAVQSALPAVLEPGELWEMATVSHPENVLLQTLIDHGAVGGALVLLSAALVLFGLLTDRRVRALAPGLSVLVLLVVGDLVDFSLEVGFGILLAACALGLAAAAKMQERGPWRRTSWPLGAALVVVLSALSVFAGAVALSDVRYDTDRAIQEARGDERRELLLYAVARHPSDSHYAYALAVDARNRRDAKLALKWANVALNLWPGHASAHVEVARALAALGRLDQALLEYRLAWISDPGRHRELLREVARRTKDVELRRRALPPDNAWALANLCELLRAEKRHADADACLGEAARMAGASEKIRLAWVRAALERKDGEEALARIAALREGAPVDGELAALEAQARALSSSLEEAYAAASSRVARLKAPVPLEKWRLDAAVALERYDDARRIIEALRRSLSDPEGGLWLDRKEAEILERIEAYPEALEGWRRVARRAPRDLAAAIRVARLELRLGLLRDAKATVARAKAMKPDHPEVRALVAALEAAQAAAAEERVRRLFDDDRR